MGRIMTHDNNHTSRSHGRRKTKKLMSKSMSWFIACIAALFILAIPAFYFLTKNYYAEDMEDLIEAVQTGKGIPANDLKDDIMKGVMLQYLLITAILCAAIALTIRLLSRKLWLPFNKTLECVDTFRLENMEIPNLPKSNITEFESLNSTLRKLMKKDIDCYIAQKEFTENASHELQTPLAIFQTKLELLLQQPELSAEQAGIIQDLFQMTSRLSHLNRNLLLLAKIDNKQFDTMERIQLDTFTDSLISSFESIASELHITKQYSSTPIYVNANRALLECMVSNLFINAARHNAQNGTIKIVISHDSMAISNTADGTALPSALIFNRFYRPVQNKGGNGLGLAIVKAICDYHGWNIEYMFKEGRHNFIVCFNQSRHTGEQ